MYIFPEECVIITPIIVGMTFTHNKSVIFCVKMEK